MKYLLLLLLASHVRAAPLLTSQSFGNHIAVNGSTTPAAAQFDVAPSSSVSTSSYVLTVSSANKTTVMLGVTASGHVGGLAVTSPALSSCGTSSLDGNATDSDGKVTVVGTALTACTITFAIPYTTYEHCLAVSDNTAFVAAVTSQSTTAITVSFTVAINSGSFVYYCKGL